MRSRVMGWIRALAVKHLRLAWYSSQAHADGWEQGYNAGYRMGRTALCAECRLPSNHPQRQRRGKPRGRGKGQKA